MSSNTLLYADNLNVYSVLNNVEDATVILQNDLNAVEDLYRSNKLTLNVNKSKMISVTQKVSPFSYQYNIGANILVRVSVIKDVGVI